MCRKGVHIANASKEATCRVRVLWRDVDRGFFSLVLWSAVCSVSGVLASNHIEVFLNSEHSINQSFITMV